MYKCIYSLKSESEAHFIEREHIFPKTLGGINTLPLGTVSDEVNASFSSLEKDFVKNDPFIQLGKMFYGPWGRKKHDKKDSIRIMISREDNKPELGYLMEGKPYPIPQFSIPYKMLQEYCTGKNTIAVKIPYNKANTNIVEANREADQMMQSLEERTDAIEKNPMRNRPQIRLLPKNSNEILVGFYRNNLFLGIPQIEKYNKRYEYIRHILKFVRYISQTAKRDNGFPTSNKELVTMEVKWVINIKVICRVVAKIAFNCLTKLYGQEFVLEECFNKLRIAILTGDGIEKFVQIPDSRKGEIRMEKCLPLSLLNISSQSHLFICMKINNRLEGYVTFYGFRSYRVIFTDEVPLNFERYPSFFACDWRNQKEYDTNDLFKKLRDIENQTLNM